MSETYGTKTSKFPADYPGETSTFVAQDETYDEADIAVEKGGDWNQVMAEVRAIGKRVGKDSDTAAGAITTRLDQNGFFHPVSSADASAPVNSVYYSTNQAKLVYKDSGGVVNDLY